MGENRSRNANHKANNVGYTCKQELHRMAMINIAEPVWAEQCKSIQLRVYRLRVDNVTERAGAAHMG